jgi:hypothetical protein
LTSIEPYSIGLNDDMISTMSTTRPVIEILIETFPEKKWRWGGDSTEVNREYVLSDNSAITAEFILRHHDKPWNWGRYGLSNHRSVSTDVIKCFLDKPWCWGCNGLSNNELITPEFIRETLDKPWDWDDYGLSLNLCITPSFVEEFIDSKPWEWGYAGLSMNSSVLSPEFITQHLDKPWNWRYVLEGIPLSSETIHWILENKSIFGDVSVSHSLMVNPYLTESLIDEFEDRIEWEWGQYGITQVLVFIIEFSEKTLDFLERHLDKPIDWGTWGMSLCSSLSLDWILSHPELPWNWGTIQEHNKNLTAEFIESHPELPWKYKLDRDSFLMNHYSGISPEYILKITKEKVEIYHPVVLEWFIQECCLKNDKETIRGYLQGHLRKTFAREMFSHQSCISLESVLFINECDDTFLDEFMEDVCCCTFNEYRLKKYETQNIKIKQNSLLSWVVSD